MAKIESINDYEDLIMGSQFECDYYINLSMIVIQDMNLKLGEFTQESFITSTSRDIPEDLIKINGSSTEFSRAEVIRIFKLIAINSEFEQIERLLLLYFLFKSSMENENIEQFGEIVKFLYHLSELRRFNDAFMAILDDIFLFGTRSENGTDQSEIDFLLNVLCCKFFLHKIPKDIQVTYIGFLTNLSYCSRKINYNHVPK